MTTTAINSLRDRMLVYRSNCANASSPVLFDLFRDLGEALDELERSKSILGHPVMNGTYLDKVAKCINSFEQGLP